jgi:YD repeat-containing protein
VKVKWQEQNRRKKRAGKSVSFPRRPLVGRRLTIPNFIDPGLFQPKMQSVLGVAGRVTKVTDANGKSTQTIYDSAGQVKYTLDAYGGKTATITDARGQAIRTVYADGTETRTAYDASGRAEWTSDRFYSGATISAAGVPSAPADIAALATRTLYDSLGRASGSERYKDVLIKLTIGTSGLFAASGPNAATLQSAGKRLSVNSTAYDTQGRVKEIKDASGLITQTEYYTNGQVKRTRQVASSTATPWTSYAYDQRDNLPPGATHYDAVTDALGRVTRTYKDVIGRAIRTTFHDGSFTETEYGGAFGSIVKTYDQRKTGEAAVDTERHYDVLGRLTHVYLPAVLDADPGSPTYNQSVRPLWQYGFDKNGNQLTQIDPKGRTTSFGYDEQNRRISRTLPGGVSETWTYDAFGRVDVHTDFKGQARKYVYDTDPRYGGRLLEEHRFTGGVNDAPDEKTVYTYDDLGRQKEVKEHKVAALTRTTSYTFDSVKVTETRYANGAASETTVID